MFSIGFKSAVPRLVNDLKWLLSQEIPDPLRGVAGGQVLQEVGRLSCSYGDGSILLQSKYLQHDTSTKIKFFGAFSEFLCLR
jgi:hypothetical protein